MCDFMKLCPVGAVVLNAAGRTGGRREREIDMTKLMFAFENFADALKNIYIYIYIYIYTTLLSQIGLTQTYHLPYVSVSFW
jgi:hypothetical protein